MKAMTTKLKAEELVNKFRPYADWNGIDLEKELINSKQCALIAVDEILQLVDEQMQGFLDTDIIAYWNQVKIEIENL